MSYVLLTGAGFSRNWGGWLADECFEYLLSCSEITPVIRRELRKIKNQKLGFENTLQELRALSAKHQDDRHRSELSAFELMLEGMFVGQPIGDDGCPRTVCTGCGMIGADVRPDWGPTSMTVLGGLAEFER